MFSPNASLATERSVPRHIGCVLLAVGAFANGCARREEPVYPVSGQVLLAGQPLAEAVVVFHPQDGARRSLTAHTDQSGRFRLTTHKPGDGASLGMYVVTIEYRDLVQEGDERVRLGPNRLPARYAQPAASELRCEIIAGANELPTWDLASR